MYHIQLLTVFVGDFNQTLFVLVLLLCIYLFIAIEEKQLWRANRVIYFRVVNVILFIYSVIGSELFVSLFSIYFS